VGAFQLKNMLEGLDGIGFALLRTSGMEREEIQELTTQVKQEMLSKGNHCYSWV
jgi:hypothetical protein